MTPLEKQLILEILEEAKKLKEKGLGFVRFTCEGRGEKEDD